MNTIIDNNGQMEHSDRRIPEISVVLPCYNGERYLREAVKSIMDQTFTDWELIIVDDWSSDTTPNIIRELVKEDKRIKSIRNSENLKLPRALNAGFEIARGRYLTWMSDDNLYENRAFARMYQELEEYGDISMVCADMLIIDSEGKVLGSSVTYDDKKFWRDNRVGLCVLYRREVYETIGGFDPDLFLVEDYDYWARIRSAFGYIQRIPEILYRYRIHDSTLTNTRSREILHQLNRFRAKHINEIISSLSDDKEALSQILMQMGME